MLQRFFNPDTVLALIVLVVVLALSLVIMLSGRPDRRMEFFQGLMKDFPKDDNGGGEGRSRESINDDCEIPVSRNIDF